MKKKALSLSLTFLFTGPPAIAQILLGWDVNGIDVEEQLSPGTDYALGSKTTAANVESSNLTLGSGVNPSTTSGQYGFKVSGGHETSSLTEAVNADHFFQFGITATPGYLLNLTSLDLFGQSSGDGADSVALLASTDDFATSATLGSLTGISGETGGFDTDGSGFGAVDLSGYANVETVSFRLYGWNTTSGGGITYVRNLNDSSLDDNDLVINGSVTPIPELVSTFSVVAFLGSPLLFRRRPGKRA